MLKKLSERDFAVLRGPLESGRQSPNSLAFALMIAVFFQPLMMVLVYIVAADDSIYPYKNIIFYIHIFITSIIFIMSVVFSIPFFYKKAQKIQYLTIILASQNIGGTCFYLMALFFVGQDKSIDVSSLMIFTYVSMTLGLLIFIFTSIRFYILLKKGEYRAGSKKGEIRYKAEQGIKSYLSLIIIGSIGLLFNVQFLIRNLSFLDIESIFMITLCILLFYAMMFVLPEQLVILYCKYRFDSFNFNKRGELNPMGRKGA